MYGLTATDSYKLFHHEAYDEDITHVYSNMTSRNGRLSNIKDNEKVVFIGVQYFILNFLIDEINDTFFKQNKYEAVEYLKDTFNANLGGDYDTSRFEALWDLGYLPLSIKALPEGSLVPYNVPCLVFENTIAGYEWLTNYIETVMSAELWMMQTSATTSVAYYKTFKEAFVKTGVDTSLIPFMGHDFSFRGMAGRHAAAMSGFGHLASGFVGTDTLPSLRFAQKYYGANLKEELVGVSVPATEHSTMTSSILKKVADQGITYAEAEKQTFQELMQKVPEGILSVVSDSFDFWSVVTDLLPSLKDDIMARNGKLVIRPDSGDPVDVLCGDPKGSTTAERRGLVESLWHIFGGTTTEEGFKLLDEHIGAIYGDSITHERQKEICNRLIAKGFCPTVVLGIGSFTFQYVTRDTHGSAVKATNVTLRNSMDLPICKDPKTDAKKKSAKGLLRVEEEGGTLVLYDEQTREEAEGGLFQEVFRDGRLTKKVTLQEIRDRIQSQI